MATQPLTPAQAGDLAQQFHDLAAAIGSYRLQNVATLSATQQAQLQNQQALCTNLSNTWIAAGLSLEQNNLAATLQQIKQATTQAQEAITNIATVNTVLQIVSAIAVLGASIASMNPTAIASGVQGVITAIAPPAAAPASSAAAAPAASAKAGKGGKP
jgi:hypothetical protein